MSVHFLTGLKKEIYCLLKNRYIFIKYSNGIGNNFFQYNFCYLFSIHSNVKIINKFSLNKSMYSIHNRFISRAIFFLYKIVGENNPFISKINNGSKKLPESFLILFEDTGEVLEIFQGKEELLRNNFYENNSGFDSLKDNHKYKNIVIHLRLGDRLLRKSDYEKGMFYDLKKLQRLINLEVKNTKKKIIISIVTDTPNIMSINNKKDFHSLKSHTYVPKKYKVDAKKALLYIFQIKKFISKNKINIIKSESLSKDFAVMLNADILIMLHGTLSWWAGYLGNQQRVYVSRLWRPQKLSNPLLSEYKSKRWLKW